MTIPIWVLISAVPFVVLFVFSLFIEGNHVGSYFGSSSDREWFLALGLFPAAFGSALIAAIYFAGKSYGWWL